MTLRRSTAVVHYSFLGLPVCGSPPIVGVLSVHGPAVTCPACLATSIIARVS